MQHPRRRGRLARASCERPYRHWLRPHLTCMSGSLQWCRFAHLSMMVFVAKTDRNREGDMRRTFRTATIVTMMLVMSAIPALAQTGPSEGQNTLAQTLSGAWLPLESGLVISAHEGTPLS